MLSGGNVGVDQKANNYRSGAGGKNKPIGKLDDLDDLDDMLDGLGNKANKKNPLPKTSVPVTSDDDLDDLWGAPKASKLITPAVQKRRIPSANQHGFENSM